MKRVTLKNKHKAMEEIVSLKHLVERITKCDGYEPIGMVEQLGVEIRLLRELISNMLERVVTPNMTQDELDQLFNTSEGYLWDITIHPEEVE